MGRFNPEKLFPEAIRMKLLKSYHQFKYKSMVNYFENKTDGYPGPYTLYEIMVILKFLIKEEKQFDANNSGMIICNPDLERVLTIKVLHITQLEELVSLLVTPIPPKLQKLLKSKKRQVTKTSKMCQMMEEELRRKKNEPNQTLANPTQQLERQPFIPYNNPASRFSFKDDLIKVMKTVPEYDQNKESFSFNEAAQLLSRYIRSNQEKLINSRNKEVAICENDLLGIAFGVRAFHRRQTIILLKRCLIYKDPVM